MRRIILIAAGIVAGLPVGAQMGTESKAYGETFERVAGATRGASATP